LYFELWVCPAEIIVVFDFIHGWQIQIVAFNDLAHLLQVLEITIDALLIVFSDIDDSPDYLYLVVRSGVDQRHLTQLTVIRPHPQVLFVTNEFFSCFSTRLAVKISHLNRLLQLIITIFTVFLIMSDKRA
jgi:hypothetical protein